MPAMKSLFEEGIGGTQKPESDTAQTQPHSQSRGAESKSIGQEIKLVSVMSSIQGEEVETRWGLYPQCRRDLTLEESRELSGLCTTSPKFSVNGMPLWHFLKPGRLWYSPGQAGHAYRSIPLSQALNRFENDYWKSCLPGVVVFRWVQVWCASGPSIESETSPA